MNKISKNKDRFTFEKFKPWSILKSTHFSFTKLPRPQKWRDFAQIFLACLIENLSRQIFCHYTSKSVDAIKSYAQKCIRPKKWTAGRKGLTCVITGLTVKHQRLFLTRKNCPHFKIRIQYEIALREFFLYSDHIFQLF